MFRKKKIKYAVTLTGEELRILRNGLIWWRNQVISRGIPTDDIDDILRRIL